MPPRNLFKKRYGKI